MEISEVWVTVTDVQSPNVTFYPSKDNFDLERHNASSMAISPYSISAAIMILMLGTRGRAKAQLSALIFHESEIIPIERYNFYKTLREILPSRKRGFDIKLANQLFANSKFTVNDTIKEKERIFFDAGLRSVNMNGKLKRSTRLINNWINRKTKGNFHHALSYETISERTAVVFVSTVTFKAEWKTKFDMRETTREVFYTSRTDKITVQMMNIIHKVRYGQLLTSKVLILPLLRNDLDVVIILPEAMTELPVFEKTLSIDIIRHLNTSLQERLVDITIPKFRMENQLDLKAYLPKRGVTEIFNHTTADFGDLINENTNSLYVSDAFHRVVVKVNENGRQAMTRNTTREGSSREKPYAKFVANRPFIYYVYDTRSGMILFLGRFFGEM